MDCSRKNWSKRNNLITIVICGDRNWDDFNAINEFLIKLLSIFNADEITVVHGDCRGADKISGYLAKKLGITVIPEAADWKRYGLGAGPKRNQYMLEKHNPIMVVGFHDNYAKSKGTRDMIERATAQGYITKVFNSRGENVET